MASYYQTKKTETLAQLHRRLADKARAEGVKLLHDRTTGQYFATSSTDPNRRYEVGQDGCTCKGFRYHSYCKHQAAFLTAMAKQQAELVGLELAS